MGTHFLFQRGINIIYLESKGVRINIPQTDRGHSSTQGLSSALLGGLQLALMGALSISYQLHRSWLSDWKGTCPYPLMDPVFKGCCHGSPEPLYGPGLNASFPPKDAARTQQ